MSQDAAPPVSVQQLLEGVRKGMVPRAIRLFAAQGLLPVSRADLIRVLILVAVDGDEEIAATAKESLGNFSVEQFLEVLRLEDLEPIEIDLLARSVSDEALFEAVIRDPRTADETLLWLGRNAGPRIQDALITNQVRILNCLEILEELRANPQASPESLRRVREFEEEFLEKAIRWASGLEEEPELEAGVSIEEALSALRDIGMQLPGGEPSSAPGVEQPESSDPQEIQDAFVRLAMMNAHQKIMAAVKGSREERMILVRDRSTLVVRAVMASPKMNLSDVEHVAGLRTVNEEALRIIAKRGIWTRRYGVVRNLVFNPKTPAAISIQMLGRLSVRDLGFLTKDRGVSEAVRRVARERYAQRR